MEKGSKHTEEAKKRIRQAKCTQRGDPIKLFWSKVDKSAGPEGCWSWMGTIGPKGYGWTRWERKRSRRVHRISWSLAFGPIPQNLHVCHHCDNPPCVNPKHLFTGTPKDNARDRDSKGRQAKGESRNAPRGEDHPGSRLTKRDVLEIRKLAADGILRKEIATKFKVSLSTVYQIINRKMWKHIK